MSRNALAGLLLVGISAECGSGSGRSFADIKAAVIKVSTSCPAKEQPAKGVQRNFRLVSCGDFVEGPVGYRWPNSDPYRADRPGLSNTLGGRYYIEGSNWLVVTITKTDAQRVADLLHSSVHDGADYR